jgi:hypothetical protein
MICVTRSRVAFLPRHGALRTRDTVIFDTPAAAATSAIVAAPRCRGTAALRSSRIARRRGDIAYNPFFRHRNG